MERERLTRLVQDAAAVERGDLADLEALTKRFPWFSGAQVLRSVGVQKAGEVLAEESFRAAAAHVPSRTALFDHVNREFPLQRLSVVKETPETPVISTEPNAPTVLPLPRVASIPAAVAATVVLEVLEEPPTVAVIPEVHVEEVPTEVLQTEVHEEPTLAPPEQQAPEENVTEAGEALVVVEALQPEPPPTETVEAETDLDEDPLERQIMESAISHAYDISWLELGPAPVKAEPEKAAPVDIPTPKPVVPIAPLQPASPTKFVTRHDRLSFTGWLTASVEAPVEAPPVIKAQGSMVPEAVADWLRQPEETPTPPIAPEAPPVPVVERRGEVDTKSLIDKFIKQQTPVAATKTEFFTPQQAAKRSLDDKAGMVTETLARVYAKQGNLPKAIDAYKRLALKYPEKSAYFAALQKELEAQLNK